MKAAAKAARNAVLRPIDARRLRSGQPQLTTRTDLLNFLALHGRAKRYLEIGVRDPLANFDRVLVGVKHGVDPEPKRGHIDFRVTSDEFFAMLDSDANPIRYDLVFIDGLHEAGQAQRDAENALRYLAPGGYVVMHDCNPHTEADQVDIYDGVSHWNGTTWKGYARLRGRGDLEMTVVDIDEGCGVIRPGSQEPVVVPDDLDFSFLDAHRRELLHLVSADEFVRSHLRGARVG